MKSLEFKFMNLKKAFLKLEEAAERYDENDDIIRDSLIQRFEFTYELCHKTLHEFMKYEGIYIDSSFPRAVFKKAYASNLISDERVWINLLEDRNLISHIYNEKASDEIAHRILSDYISAIGELILNLEKTIS